MRKSFSLFCSALLLLFTAEGALGTPLSDDLLTPMVPRLAPRPRPEILPRPFIYTARSVLYSSLSGDGKWIATVEKGDNGSELWLHSTSLDGPLPRLLWNSSVRIAAPALNRDGSLLAFVDAREDVKGDIWLFNLHKGDREPSRLTGSDSGDDAPVFTPDGKQLAYQRQIPGSPERTVVLTDLAGKSGRTLPIAMDAGFPAPSPDGRSWLFVSRNQDPNGDLWLWEEAGGTTRQLTGGEDQDLYPAWDKDGSILFARTEKGRDEGKSGTTRIYRINLRRLSDNGLPYHFPLTSGKQTAIAPIPAGDGFLSVVGQGSGGQLLYLPYYGEIPRLDTVDAQWVLARQIGNRQPADPLAEHLALQHVLARDDSLTREGALAGIALGLLYEKEGDRSRAVSVYGDVVKRYAGFPQEAATAAIAGTRVRTADELTQIQPAQLRSERLHVALQTLEELAKGNGNDAAARSLIDRGRLLTDFGAGAADQLTAIGLYEQTTSLSQVSRPLLAEAAFRRALLLSRLEKGEGALSSLTGVVRDYQDQEEWAEAALAAILDQSAFAGTDTTALAALAEKYRDSLPRLAMGAWNRIGDHAWQENEWARAKDAYRTVLEKFAPLPTPTAAARFALAEVLYREERYAEAKDLYEQEMAGHPEDTPLYALARSAYIRKTLAAGENLYRTGELAAARSLFLDLIRYDGRNLEAHRGYIKSVAAQGQASELLALYRSLLTKHPDDPVILYSAGLCATYLPGRDQIREADRLIARAAARMPESEYPPQTRGYIAEVTETVHGERGGLERAMQLYRRAWFLNRGQENRENRANLDLNIGNIAFLLGSNATAWSHYKDRLAAKIPFDNQETELIFYRRYAATAFQMKELEAPITGYSRALELVEKRLNPLRPIDLLGKAVRRTFERLFSDSRRSHEANSALSEQQSIAEDLDKLASRRLLPPPSPEWDSAAPAIRSLLERQKALISSAASWNRQAASLHTPELHGLLLMTEKAFLDLPTLAETSAELHDRLGLSLLEADRFKEAAEQFAASFRLNKGLGVLGNLVANRRSESVARYRAAELTTGEERERLLASAADGFRDVLSLIKLYPPKRKEAEQRSGGLVSVGASVALDKMGATRAAFGFTADQEERLAETFLARIQSIRGEPAAAATILKGQLRRYPAANERLAPGDLYGVGLLTHRIGHLNHALGETAQGADDFRRSTLLSIQAGNPVSAMLNLVNWGELLSRNPMPDALNDFLSIEAQTSLLAQSYRETLPPLSYARYLNDTAVILSRLAPGDNSDPRVTPLLYTVINRLDRALTAAAADTNNRSAAAARVRAAVQINRGALFGLLSLDEAKTSALLSALAEASEPAARHFTWRALASLGRYEEAVQSLADTAPAAYDALQGEILERFAPYIEHSALKDPEKAFALLEKLSELERVQILGRAILGLDDPLLRGVLAAAASHLAVIDQLNSQAATVSPEEKSHRELRRQQEQLMVDSLLGRNFSRLPVIYRKSGVNLVPYAAASAAVAEAADRSTEVAYQTALLRFQAVSSRFAKDCSSGKGLPFCSFLVPQPVEAIDVLEQVSGRLLLRFTPLDRNRWLLFTLGGPKGIRAETVFRKTLEERLAAQPAQLATHEEPGRFSNRSTLTWGLSASHLLRSLANRRPFRRTVLDSAGWWPAGTQFEKLPPDQFAGKLPFAHTLVLPGNAGLLPLLPAEAGRAAGRALLWDDTASLRRPLTDLAAAGGLSLVIAPKGTHDQAYALGHALTLMGIPSLLLAGGDQTPPRAADPSFASHYAASTLSEARLKLPAGWLLLGDWGPDPAEAAALGKKQFSAFGTSGVRLHNEQRYHEALASFENALAIAGETRELAKHRSTLYRYSRESAYAAGETERALYHGEELLKLLAKERPYSPEHADAYLRLGLLQGRAERFQAAAGSLKEAVAIFSELGLAQEQASALADFGVVMENAVDYAAAGSLFEQAAGIRRTGKNTLPLADQYRNLGRLYDLRLNRYALAEGYYRQAGEIYAREGNGPLEAETLLERGRCQRLLGNFPAAEEFFRKALTLIGEKDLRTRMRITLEQANNRWFQGKYQDAFDLREQVEKTALKESWPLETVMAKNTGGLIWWTLGDMKRALLELREALSKAEKLDVRRDEVATTLNNIGLVERESGNYSEALATLEKALAIDRALGSRWAIAYDLRNLAQTRLKMGEAAPAAKLLDEAAALASGIGDAVHQAKIHLARGDAALMLHDPRQAETSYRNALSLADTMLLREVSWRALFGLARLQQEAGDFSAARESYRTAIETVEGMRADIRLDQLKDGFLADKMDLYAGLVSLLVDLKSNDEAFAVAERSRARNLIDILGRQRLSLSGAIDQSLYDRQNRLKEQIQEQELLAVQASTSEARQIYRQGLEQLQASYQDLLLEIERQRPDLLSLVKVQPVTADEIRLLLEPGVVLLSYFQLSDRLLCWRMQRDRTDLFILDAPAARLAETVSSYRRMLQNLEPLEAASQGLYETLITPVLSGLGEVKALGIVPHGPLHYMPFATLSDSRDYLIDRQSLFYLPAASVLRYTLSRRQAQKNMRVLAIGNPDLGNSALDLPFAEREAATLKWNYPAVTTLTRERATESWVRDHISEFGIIHLASHGEFDPVNPLFSAIRLTPDKQADGKLQADEIFGLDIRADLVVLSACQTGLGDIRRGDDVVGMNRAFIFAGTHSLISSLWRVSDVSTAILMKQFYREYTREGKSASLRRAMLHVKNRYPHPGYWGAFVLTGDFE